MLYAVAMATKTIPWKRVEELLDERQKSREWFELALKLEKNNISNWKNRGVPKARVAEIANLLNTTSDYLLERDGAAKDAHVSKVPSNYDDIVRLVMLFNNATIEGRIQILDSAESAPKITARQNVASND